MAEGWRPFLVAGSGAGGRDGEGGRGRVVGGRVAEDEEFDKGPDEDHDGELAEEEALSKGEPAFVSILELSCSSRARWTNEDCCRGCCGCASEYTMSAWEVELFCGFSLWAVFILPHASVPLNYFSSSCKIVEVEVVKLCLNPSLKPLGLPRLV